MEKENKYACYHHYCVKSNECLHYIISGGKEIMTEEKYKHWSFCFKPIETTYRSK